MSETSKKTKAPEKSGKPAVKSAAKSAVKSVAAPAAKPVAKKAAKPAPRKESPAPAKQAPTHDEIASLARRFWAERGHHDGHAEQDWLRAEQQLRNA